MRAAALNSIVIDSQLDVGDARHLTQYSHWGIV
jgi:hypothetical protein